MRRDSDTPPPPRMAVAELIRKASKWSLLAPGGKGEPAPVAALRLATTAADLGLVGRGLVGRLARSLTSFIGDRKVDKRLLFRIGLFILSNAPAYNMGLDVDAILASRLRNGGWEAFEVTDVISGGYTKRGIHMWDVSCVRLWGPAAGMDFFMTGPDGYLCGIVREISGARFSNTVAPVDLSLMRFRAYMEGGGIVKLDGGWSSAKTHNSEIRRQREGCPKGPCERCGRTRSSCRWSPYPANEGKDNGQKQRPQA